MNNESQTIVGRYELIGEIAEGGMGRVYKARHAKLDEFRVIKTLRAAVVGDAEHRQRFEREVSILRELGHPQIVRAYDSAVGSDGTAFLVLEYVDGITLDELVTRGLTPSLGLAVEIADQALTALAFIHGRGVIHRDIAADNLMLAPDDRGEPQVKLLDLGIATRVGTSSEQLTNVGTFLGKIRYTAPEQFGSGGATSLDRRSDLYSFGVLFYQLLTGHCPILGSTFSEVSSHHLFKPPLSFAESDPTGRIPDGLRSLVLASLEKKVADRVADAETLRRAIQPWRDPERSLGDETTYLVARIRADRESVEAVEEKKPDISVTVRVSELFRADEPEPPPLEAPAAAAGEPRSAEHGSAAARPTEPIEPVPAPSKPQISIPPQASPVRLEPTRAAAPGSALQRGRRGVAESITRLLAGRWRWLVLLLILVALLLLAARAFARRSTPNPSRDGREPAFTGAMLPPEATP